MIKERTALNELLVLIEKGEPIMPTMKMQLVDLMRKQLMDAYNLDPELMKVRYKDAKEWYHSTYIL